MGLLQWRLRCRSVGYIVSLIEVITVCRNAKRAR